MSRKLYMALIGLLFGIVALAGDAQAQASRHVRVTYYVDTGVMASGQHTHFGAAACSTNFAFGTRIVLPDGLSVTCLDRGVLGSTGWVDIWVPSLEWGRQNVARNYGDYADVAVYE